jgi:hypothetical protein
MGLVQHNARASTLVYRRNSASQSGLHWFGSVLCTGKSSARNQLSLREGAVLYYDQRRTYLGPVEDVVLLAGAS